MWANCHYMAGQISTIPISTWWTVTKTISLAMGWSQTCAGCLWEVTHGSAGALLWVIIYCSAPCGLASCMLETRLKEASWVDGVRWEFTSDPGWATYPEGMFPCLPDVTDLVRRSRGGECSGPSCRPKPSPTTIITGPRWVWSTWMASVVYVCRWKGR